MTNGGKHAVFTAFATLCDPGDEVHLSGAVLDHVPRGRSRSPAACRWWSRPTRRPASGSPSSSSKQRAQPRTKALLFVSPDNPSGAVYTPDEVEAIGRWAVENGVWVMTDEIYEHLTYGPHKFVSMPTVVPELADQCIIVNGVAKTYAMTGWRVGWMIGPQRRDEGRDQLPVAHHVERQQRRPAGGARGGQRRPLRGGHDARSVRAPRPSRCTRC